MKKLIYILLMVVAVSSSCKKDDETPGTAMKAMAGEWFLRYSTDGGATWSSGYTHFSTYNTAANSSTEMYLDDLESFWEFKGKVTVDLNSKSFSGKDVENQYYDSKFTVTDGKLNVKGTTAPASGTVADELTFKVTFSDDDDELVYLFSGYKKTGFLEDEH